MNIIVSIISGVFTAILVILFKDYIDFSYYSKRNAKRKFKLAVLSFMLKSRLPEFSWRSTDDEQVRKAIQLIHLKPIYKEFHKALISKPPHIRFKAPPFEKVNNLSCKSLKEAEKRTICHVSLFLFESGEFDNIAKPSSYLFDDQETIYDFPARFWIKWLEENRIKYFKFKK